MENYFQSKTILFKGLGVEPPRFAVINIEDEYGQRLLPLCKKHHEVITYGIERGEFHARDLKVSGNGVGFQLVTPRGEIPIWSPMLGRVNVYNLVAAAAAAYARDVEPNAISEAADQIAHVAGRFERLDLGQPFTVIVDYAHTDDAIRNLTAVAHDFLHQRGGPGRVITVFGCGGDRDRAKRPLMGEAAGRGSDFVVLTSDNPRSEDPIAIMNDALPGLQRTGARYTLEPDRHKAIELAIHEAEAGDIVLIAGKGHEKHQVTSEGVVPFDDVEVAQKALHTRRIRRRASGQIMKLTLARAAEFMQASGEFDPTCRRQRLFHRFPNHSAGRTVFCRAGRTSRRPRLRRRRVVQGRGRGGGAPRSVGALSGKHGLLAVDDTLDRAAAACRGGAPALGQAAGGSNRLRGKDDHQGNRRACAGDPAPRAEVARQSQQSFWPAAAVAEAGTRA